MASLPPRDDAGGWREVPGAFMPLIRVSLSELRRDVAELLETGWSEPDRRRTHELATVLDQACGRQGLGDLARVSRSIASLACLSRREAAPLLPELEAKFKDLLAQADRLAWNTSTRFSTG